MSDLNGEKVAILVANGFEQDEFAKPKQALERAGAEVSVVSPEEQSVKGWKHTDWGDTFDVDAKLDDADPGNYDAIVLPGGQMNPDLLRINKHALSFIKHFFDNGKPVAAICHAPWLVIEAGEAKGRRLTSWPSVRTDLVNAGADWVDEEVVEDRGLVTSRKPGDLPAFNEKIIEVFAR